MLVELCFAKVNDSTTILARFVICRAVLCELCLPKVKDVWANLRVFASCEALPGAADLKFLQDASSKMQNSGRPTPQARRSAQGPWGGRGGGILQDPTRRLGGGGLTAPAGGHRRPLRFWRSGLGQLVYALCCAGCAWRVELGELGMASWAWRVGLGKLDLANGVGELGEASWAWRVGLGVLGLASWAWRVELGELGLANWAWRVGLGEFCLAS